MSYKMILCRFARTVSVMDLRHTQKPPRKPKTVADMVAYQEQMGIHGKAVYAS